MTATYNLNKTNLLTLALKKANVVAGNQTPTDYHMSIASDLLNLMIKDWEGNDIQIWKRKIAYLFPSYSGTSYSLGSSGDNCTQSYVSTTISSDEALGQTTLSITSSAGMTANDYIGIELDDGTRQWSTIASIPDSTSVIINDALTDSASATNTVVSYTTKITRPLKIIRGTCLDLKNSNTETTMWLLSHDEYFDLPNKSSLGKPNNMYYDKLINGTTPYTGTFYIYPAPQFVYQILTFSYHESLADASNPTDYFDFPQEWIKTIFENITVAIAEFFGKYTVVQELQPRAQALLDKMSLHDTDDAPLSLRLKK